MDLLKLFWPVLVEQLLNTTIGIVNTMMVSGVGAAAISAVGVVDSMNVLAMNLFTSLATGATVMIAQYVGAGRGDKANEAVSQSVSACILLAVLSSVVMLSFDRALLGLLFPGTELAVTENAVIYLRYSAISYPFLAAFSIAAGVLRASRNTTVPMLASVLINIVNVGVSALTIYVFDMGVAGAGVGLLTARVVGAAILMFVICNPHTQVHMERFTFVFKKAVLWPILRIGVPAGIDSMVFNGGKLVVATMIASFGTIAMSANSIAGSVNSFVMIPGNAIMIAATTVIGIAVGAGDKKEVRKLIWKLNIYSMVLVSAVIVAFTPFVPWFLSLYSPEPGAFDLAQQITYLTLICLPIFWTMAFMTPACLRSTGDVVYVTIVSIASMWIFRVAGAWIYGVHFGAGLFGIWIFWCVDWAVRAVLFFIRTKSGGYEKKMREIT